MCVHLFVSVGVGQCNYGCIYECISVCLYMCLCAFCVERLGWGGMGLKEGEEGGGTFLCESICACFVS